MEPEQHRNFRDGPAVRPENCRVALARTPEDWAVARALVREYEAWLGVDLCFQGFAAELAAFDSVYGPPKGAMLLAWAAGPEADTESAIGCVGLREVGEGIGEMKRMFVRPERQDRGVGRWLLVQLIDTARTLGYQCVRLDTLQRLEAALALYRKFGFRDIPPYRHNPDPETVYLQLDLRA